MYPNNYIGKESKIQQAVWYAGTDTVLVGEPFCYNNDYGTASAEDGSRMNRVERPTYANNLFFAGVADDNYYANAAGQSIIINRPGSVCQIVLRDNVTIGTSYVTALCGDGDNKGFVTGGLMGEGTALALQTVTALVSQNMVATTMTCSAGSTGKVITDSAATWTTTGSVPVAGDKFIVYSGGIKSVSTTPAIIGYHNIASVTSATVLVTSDSVGVSGTQVHYKIISGNPTCLAYLIPGPPSGLVQYCNIMGGGGAKTSIINHGTLRLMPKATLGANATATLSAGKFNGQKLAIACITSLQTNDFVLTFTGTNKAGKVRSTLAASHITVATCTIDATDAATFTYDSESAIWICIADRLATLG